MAQARTFSCLGALMASGALFANAPVSAQQTVAAPADTPLSNVAPAQAQADPVAPDAATSGMLEDIVVTAQRRTENLQDVPISVTAVSEQRAQQLNIRDLPALQLVTPGLSFTTGNDYAMVYIRGVGANFSNPGVENPVGVYVDGAYVPRSLGGNLDVFDTSSVQILKGPQGTLWGRNATGGAMLITTADPVFENTGRIQGEVGNLGRREVEGVVNLPLVDDVLALRVAGRYLKDGGYITNLPDGNRLGWSNRSTLRAKLLYKPDADYSAALLVQRDAGENSQQAYGQFLPTGFCLLCRNPGTGYGYPLDDPYTTTLNTFNNGVGNVNRSTTANLRLGYTTGIVSLASVTAYNRNSSVLTGDFDYTSVQSLEFYIPSASKVFNQSLTATTESGGMFDGLVGVEYLNERSTYDIYLQTRLNPPFEVPRPPALIRTRSFSAFAEVTAEPIDRLKITAGGRYTHDSRFGARQGEPNQRIRFDSFVPRVVVSYDTGPVNFYASYNEGTKAGGFSSPAVPLTTFLPERLKAFEGGGKFVSADRTIRANVSAFHYDYSDLQTIAVRNADAGNIGQFQNAQAKVDGFEADANWYVVQFLELYGGLSYLHARYTDFRNAGVQVPVYGAAGQAVDFQPGTEDLTGTALPHAPRWTFFVGATVSGEIADGWKGSLSGLVNYSDSFFFFPGGGGPLRADVQPSYTTARISGFVSPVDERYQIGFFVENLTDKLFYNMRFSTAPFGGGQIPNRPRTYGIRLGFKY